MNDSLVDKFGRRMRKLRVSLLDQCNFRCLYCMPDNRVFTPTKNLLPAEEIISICTNLVDLGLEEIRLTGGEPTLRKDFISIVRGLSELPLKKLALTTNGYRLAELIGQLKNSNCRSLNISIDSLDQENFLKITGVNRLSHVLAGIKYACSEGFLVKINMVVMRGINDHELMDFVEFAHRYPVEVRFLEVMNIGVMHDQFDQQFIPQSEMRAIIENRYPLTKQKVPVDSTAQSFKTQRGGKIGWISSESQPFCHSCSRLRLTAQGELRPCLFKSEGISLRGVNKEDYPKILGQILPLKPNQRLAQIEQPMYQIGG